MKAMKRTIAALLASMMLMASVNVSFAAETYTEAEEIVVSKVNAAGIMTGTDNGFDAEKTLTRAEAAAIMVRMKGIPESQVTSVAGDTLFSDVAATHWAAGYINVASSQNIIKGTGDGKFSPDKEVTVAEFTTMAVRALGAGPLVDSLSGTWPTNYMNFAAEEKLTEDVYRVYTSAATRMDAATIVTNTLEADVWEKKQVTNTNEVTYVKVEGKTILSDTLKVDAYENVTLKDINTKDREVTVNVIKDKSAKNGEIVEGDETLSNYDVADGVDMAGLKAGVEYDVWYNRDSKVKEIIRIEKAEDSKEKELSFTEIVKVSSTKITLMVNGEEKEYDLVTSGDNASKIKINNATEVNVSGCTDIDETEEQENMFGTFTLDGKKIKTIFAEHYTDAGVVKEVTNGKIKFESITENGLTNLSTLNIDNDDYEYVISKNGKEIKSDDIKAGDALFYYKDKSTSKKYYIEVITDTVEGEVTSVSSKYVKIDGTRYDIVSDLSGKFDEEAEIIAYKNKAGKIVMFDEKEAGSADLAMVTYLKGFESKGEQVLEIELKKMDGTVLDVMEVDMEETFKEIKYQDGTKATNTYWFNTAADSTFDTDDEKALIRALYNANADYDNYKGDGADFDESIVGEMIAYKIKGGKVVITEFAAGSNVYSKYDKDDQKIGLITTDTDLTVGKVTKWGKYYFTDSTKVFKMKKVTGKDANTEAKFEEIDVNTLDASDDLQGFVGSINDDNEVRYAVIAGGTGTVKTDNHDVYAIVLSESTTKKDDFDNEYEIVYTDGTKATLYLDEDTNVTIEEGKAYKLSVNGEEIIDADELNVGSTDKLVETALTNGYLINTKGKDVYTFAEVNVSTMKLGASAAVELALADNCVFIENDDNELKVASSSDIDELSFDLGEDVTLEDLEDATLIEKVITYIDKDGNEEIIAIIFNADEKNAATDAVRAIEKAKTLETKLNGKTDITTVYTVARSGATVTLTQKTPANLALDTETVFEGVTFKCTTAGVAGGAAGVYTYTFE